MKILSEEYSQFGRFEFLAKQTVDGFITGLHKSPYHGFSVEFSEHKQFNDGESTRFIDWKVYAKTDKLFVKKFEEETNLRCRILLDISSSMFYPQQTNGKIRFASFAAACLAYLLQKQRDAVGISVFDEQIRYQSQVKSTSMHIRQIVGELEKLPNMEKQRYNQKSHVADAIHMLAESIHKRSLVILFSDMMDESSQHSMIFNALQHLKHNKHEVLLFHVYDGLHELGFNFDSRPYEFVDLENNQRLLVNPSEVQGEVQRRMEAHAREVHLKCSQYKIEYVRADINQDVEKILEAYLVKRSKMR